MPAEGKAKKKGGGSKKKKALEAEAERLFEEARKAEENERARLVAVAAEAAAEQKHIADISRQQHINTIRRLLMQINDDSPYRTHNDDAVAALNKRIAADDEWRRYVSCEHLPDVSVVPALVTYIALYSADDTVSHTVPHRAFPHVLTTAQSAFALQNALAADIGRRREIAAGTNEQIANIETIQSCISSKFDQLTAAFLARADEYEDELAKTMTVCGATADIGYGLWVHNSAKHTRVKHIELPPMHMNIDLPVALQKNRNAIRIITSPHDFTKAIRQSAATSATVHHVPIGGIICLEQLALPPQPKVAKGWTIREYNALSTSIQSIPYPADDLEATINTSAPLKITLTLPPTIWFNDSAPVFGWWEERAKTWRRDGLSVSDFDQETRQCTLSTNTLKPIAVIQPRALDFPYAYWSITPNAEESNSALMTIKGSRVEVLINIANGQCALVQPTHPLVFQSLNTTPTSASRLLCDLAARGINMLPTYTDVTYCRVIQKNTTLLSLINTELAAISHVFEIVSMPLNGGRGSNTCLFKVRLVPDGTLQLKMAASRRAELDASAEAFMIDQTAAADRMTAVQPTSASIDSADDDDDDPDVKAAKAKARADAIAAEAAAAEEVKKAVEAERLRREEAEGSLEERTQRGIQWHTIMATIITDAPQVIAADDAAKLLSVAQNESAAKLKVENDKSVEEKTRDDGSDDVDAESTDTEEKTNDSDPSDAVDKSSDDSSKPETTISTESSVPETTLTLPPVISFIVIKGTTESGAVDLTPLDGSSPHATLRRCLLHHFHRLTPYDLTTALNLSVKNPGDGLDAPAWLSSSATMTHQQQTIARLLHLLNVFTFH